MKKEIYVFLLALKQELWKLKWLMLSMSLFVFLNIIIPFLFNVGIWEEYMFSWSCMVLGALIVSVILVIKGSWKFRWLNNLDKVD